MKIGMYANMYDETGYGRYGDAMYMKLKEHGFSCVDYSMSDTDAIHYTSTPEALAALVSHERELISGAQMELSQAHGPWRYPPRDYTEEERSERMEKMKHSIRVTAALGCKNWVIHPIMPFGIEDIGTENAQKTWDMNLSFMRELLETAKEYDITICFENMPFVKFSLSAPADILRFVKEINDEHFKICLDTGHVAVYKTIPVGDAIRELGSEIRVLHVHDNRYGIDMHLSPYYGIIDWDDFSRALKDINYQGVLSLETMPAKSMPDALFEDASIQLCKIGEKLAEGIDA